MWRIRCGNVCDLFISWSCDPTKASFKEQCKRSLEIKGVIPQMEQQLRELGGWNEKDIKSFRKNSGLSRKKRLQLSGSDKLL